MHELSLAEEILRTIEQAVHGQGCSRVREVGLEIGQLAAVDVDALTFCLESVFKGSVAEGARVRIDRVPGEGWCLQCGRPVPIDSLYAQCPRCGSPQVQATGGRELRVKDLWVE
ncbi:MAG: hydrogenase maturation nickel metallochaperone HypA [Thiobacillaceae bacterium]|nr:hydrogenase maturation nickel metallochaperone HypA [Thiobacillaceae bacterium]MDW8323613.1 hydrogenase maturation nickel metallochaperone HypA [Burkholderiales bacterium]